jgi:outer membrane protein TolC
VQFSLPFGSSSHAAPRIAEAEADLTGTQSERARVQRELELTFEQASYSVKFAQRASRLAEQQNRLASNSLRLQQRAFELGESDLVLLLRAREQAASAAQGLQRAQLEYQLAISRYNHASGVMPK